MPTAWKCSFAVLGELLAPLVNGRIRDAQLTGHLCDGLATGLHQSDRFLFEFFRVGFLNLCHATSFPGLVEYTSALLTLPNRGRLNFNACPYCGAVENFHGSERPTYVRELIGHWREGILRQGRSPTHDDPSEDTESTHPS